MNKRVSNIVTSIPVPAERRRAQRINIKQKIECKNFNDFRSLYVTNISKGGVFIKTAYPPPIGTMMRLGVHLPGTEREIEFSGKVVQCTPMGAGVQLLDMSSSDMQVMESFLTKQIDHQDNPQTLEGKFCHIFEDPNIFLSSSVDLQCASLPTLLRFIKTQGWNGVLRVFCNGEFRNIHIRLGLPIDITSSKFNENYCLGRLLKHCGSISNDELKASILEMTRTGKKQGTILLEKKLLNWDEIQKGLEWQLEIKLDEIMSWPSGTYTFSTENFEEQQENWVEPDLDLEMALFKSIYRQAQHRPESLIQVFCNYEDYETIPCEIKRRGKSNRAIFASNKEIGIWHHIVHENSPLRKLYNENSSTEENIVKAFVLGLLAAGLVSLKHPNWRKKMNSNETMKEIIASPNYFERLHIPWTSSDKEAIRAAHQRMMKYVDSVDKAEPTMVDTQTHLRKQLDEAYETLNNDYTRRSYRKNVVNRQETQSMANRLYRLGKIKLCRGSYDEAFPLLQSAADLNPGTPEFEQWLEKARQACRSPIK